MAKYIITTYNNGELGKVLIKVRKEQGLTMKQMGKIMGIHESQVWRLEDKEWRGVALERLQSAFDALGCKIRIEIKLNKAGPDES